MLCSISAKTANEDLKIGKIGLRIEERGSRKYKLKGCLGGRRKKVYPFNLAHPINPINPTNSSNQLTQ
jgi:hypothetical protein